MKLGNISTCNNLCHCLQLQLNNNVNLKLEYFFKICLL